MNSPASTSFPVPAVEAGASSPTPSFANARQPAAEADSATENENLSVAKACPRSPFMTTKQAARYLCLSSQTLDKMRVLATGPRYRKHGRYVRYHIDELNAWSEHRGHISTSDEGAK